jgi:hypothetical protein
VSLAAILSAAAWNDGIVEFWNTGDKSGKRSILQKNVVSTIYDDACQTPI